MLIASVFSAYADNCRSFDLFELIKQLVVATGFVVTNLSALFLYLSLAMRKKKMKRALPELFEWLWREFVEPL